MTPQYRNARGIRELKYCEGGSLASALRSGAFKAPGGGGSIPSSLLRTWSSASTPPPPAHVGSCNGGAPYAPHGGPASALLGPSAPLPAVAESADCNVVVPEAQLRPSLDPQLEVQVQRGQGRPRAAGAGGADAGGATLVGGSAPATAPLELEPSLGEGSGRLLRAPLQLDAPEAAAEPFPAVLAAQDVGGDVVGTVATTPALGKASAVAGAECSSLGGGQELSGPPLGRGGGGDGAGRTAAAPYAHRHRPVSLPRRLQGGEPPRAGNLPLALLAAWDVARGLEYCHSAGVVHGDINDNNILLKMASPAMSPTTAFGLPSSGGSNGGASLLPMAACAAALVSPPHAACSSTAAARASRRALMSASGMLGPELSGGRGGSSSSGRDLSFSPLVISRTADGDGVDSCASFEAGAAWPAPGQGSSSLVDPDSAAGVFSGAAAAAARRRVALDAAVGMLGTVYKIADLGLAVQLAGATHVSNLAHGTPFFAAPEVMFSGRLSPAADIYSFGVLLWLLLHGSSMTQVRHMLPRIPLIPAAPTLMARAAPELPEAARRLLADCLEEDPAARPSAAALRQRVRALMQEVAGPELAQLLLGTERKEVVVAERG